MKKKKKEKSLFFGSSRIKIKSIHQSNDLQVVGHKNYSHVSVVLTKFGNKDVKLIYFYKKRKKRVAKKEI